MKKILFIIFFFLGLGQANAVLVDSQINNLQNKGCYTSDNKYIGCFSSDGNNGQVHFYLFTKTGGLISAFYNGYGYDGNIDNVISTPRYDILINDSAFGQAVNYVIIDKTTLGNTSLNVFNSSTTDTYRGYQKTTNGIKLFFSDIYGGGYGLTSLDLTISTLTIGTDTPDASTIYKNQKQQLLPGYIIFKNDSDLKLYLQDNSGIYEFSTAVGNYIYNDGFLTLGGLSYYEQQTRQTLILSGSIIDYVLDIDILQNYSGSIISDTITDTYELLSNAEIYDIKNFADTPIFTVDNTDMYYIKTSDLQFYKTGKSITSFTFSGSTGNNTNNGSGIIDLTECKLDIDNDGDVSFLDGEFFIGAYNCVVYGFSSINAGLSNLYEFTNVIKDIGNIENNSNFISFLFGIESANASEMTDAFNQRDENSFLYKILNYIKNGMYFILIVAGILFIIMLKKGRT